MPSLTKDVVGAIELAGEPGVDPPALVDSLRERFDALGGVRRADRVIDLHRPPGRPPAVVTASATESFDRVVLAAGAWSGTLGQRLGVRLPVTSGRGYAIELPPAPGHPTRVIQLLEASMAMAPLGDRLRLCGTMEIASPTAPLDQGRIGLMLRSPGRYFEGWSTDVEPLRVMAAPRPMTPDGLPIIGPLTECAGRHRGHRARHARDDPGRGHGRAGGDADRRRSGRRSLPPSSRRASAGDAGAWPIRSALRLHDRRGRCDSGR